MLSSKTVLCLVLALAAECRAAVQMAQVETVQSAELTRQGWVVASTPASEQLLTLQIALTLKNTDQLFAKLLETSSRKSKSYGKWLDRDEVNAIVQPSKDSETAVLNWLKSEGVDKVNSDGTWVNFATTVETANRIMNANFMQFERDGVSKIRTTEYSVPLDLADHIDLIHPTTFFGKTEAFAPVHDGEVFPKEKMHKRQVRSALNQPTKRQYPKQSPKQAPKPKDTPLTISAVCKTAVSPACLKQFYNVGNYTPSSTSRSRVGFSSFLNQSAQYADLSFFQNFFKIPKQNFTKVFVNNANNHQDPETAAEKSGEANLDVQTIMGIANPLRVTEFLTGGLPPFIPDLEMSDASKNSNEPYLPYYQFLNSKTNAELPHVITNSYGEPEQTVPKRYAQRVCTMIAQLGLRGITIFESSGDTGVGSYCTTNDGSARPRFLPQFPGTCPWITAVGGTESVSPEIAWRDSSGGFSDYFPRPSYQNDAVDTYLNSVLAPKTLKALTPYFDKRGRGFPDISAHSLLPNFQIVTGGKMSASGGTSASSPVWAGLVGLLNDGRFKAGLPSLGFINPWLYESGESFLVDVTKGAARGCDGVNHQNGKKTEGASIIPNAFWNATVGWDPATGLGIPDFQKMLKSAIEDADDDGDDDDDDDDE